MYNYIFAAGIGISSALVLTALLQKIKYKLKIAKNSRLLGLINAKDRAVESDNKKSIMLFLGAVGGAIFGLLMSIETPYTLMATSIMIGLSVGAVMYINNFKEKWLLGKKRKECSTLFESIELFLHAGLSLQASLMQARKLVIHIRPAIDKALVYWPDGSVSALKILQEEIDLPEGDTLVSLLIQINQMGIENFEGVIQRESKRLEAMRDSADKISIQQMPILLNIYRFLPLMIVLALFVGSLLLRALSSMPFINLN